MEQKDIKNGLSKLFKEGRVFYQNMHITVFPEFLIEKVNLNVNCINNMHILTFENSQKEKNNKSILVAFKKNYCNSCSYNFIIKLFLSHLKEKKIPFGLKLSKIECTLLRNKEDIGTIIEYLEIYPYEYKNFILSHAIYSVILFILGLNDTNDIFYTTSNQKIIINTNNIIKAEKKHKYFKIKRNCDIDFFTFWVITGYVYCREIFECILWIMKEEFWNKHNLHFYLTLPMMSALQKIKKRIIKDNT